MINNFNYMLDHIEELQDLIITSKVLYTEHLYDSYEKINDKMQDLLLTMLLLSMGEHIPNRTYTCNDYSCLYGNLTDNVLNDRDGKVREE